MAFQRSLGLIFVAGCQAAPGGVSGFGAAPEVTTAGSTGGSSNVGSTGEGAGGAGSDGDSSGAVGDASGEPARDLPAPDFGEVVPAGCRGKIDLLFVISRAPDMLNWQGPLIEAFPGFIATIEERFADFDYHIMVIDGDGDEDVAHWKDWSWGSYLCNSVCPDLDCLADDPCCPEGFEDLVGKPCCAAPDYPCDELDLVTQCDRAWGAGSVFPAGLYAANRRCPVDGGRRYLVTGQTDLLDTFACLATLGVSGVSSALGQALTAAMQPEINAPGGCNKGFLRDDALLMVTLVSYWYDYDFLQSEGYPFLWAEAVRDAKGGDDRAVVMLRIGGAEQPCDPKDQLCELVEMFPYHLQAEISAGEYAAAFSEAAGMVEAACAEFVPPA